MAPSRRGFNQGLVLCLLIVAGFGAAFALVMLVGAVTGRGFAGGILLGGFGLVLLLLFASVLVFGVMYWRSSKSS